MKKTHLFAVLLALCMACLAFAVVAFADDTEAVLGDANGDGAVNTKDVVVIRQYLANLDYDTGVSSVEISDNADMDGDSDTDLHDLYFLRNYLVNGELPGAVKYSKGLKYTSNGDGTCYVSGIGSCTDLDIIIPPVSPEGDEVIRIGSSAFSGCDKLTSIVMPDSVTSIDSYAFYDCTSLVYNEYDNAYYLGSETNPYLALVKAKDIEIYSCEINSNTKLICADAFASCYRIASITIPDSVVSIGNDAFRSCGILNAVEIGESVTSIGDDAFFGCAIPFIVIPDSVVSIGNGAFAACSSLDYVTFANVEGWKCLSYPEDISISSAELSDETIAAEYLRETFCDCWWERD